jgi:hypothetical protein
MDADLRIAWRRLVQHPARTAAAIVTLALALGVNLAVFSGDAGPVVAALNRAAAAIEPDRPLYNVQTLDNRIGDR